MTAVVTVVVCTRDRAAMLRACLESLRAQTLPRDGYAILVVDNGSTDDTPAVAAAMADGSPPIAYVREDAVGISHARNRAVAECRTPLLAFIDDDATAAPDWIGRLIAGFSTWQPTPFAIGGEVDPTWEAPRPAWLLDRFLRMYSCNLGLGAEARPIVDGEWIFEGNCAVHVASLHAIGGFPTRLGRAGTSLLSGENVVFEIARQRGATILFEPAARIAHRVHADRMTLAWLRRRSFWQGVSDARTDRELRRHGLSSKRRRQALILPDSQDAWLALRDMSETTDNLATQIKSLESLGFVCERLGLLDR